MGKNYLSLFLSFLVLLFLNLPLKAQKMDASFNSGTIQLQIHPILNKQPLVLGQRVFVPLINDSVQIDRLRFYLSNMTFSNTSDIQENIGQQFFLIDLEDSTSLSPQLQLKKVSQWDDIHFTVGVDSATQLKGAQGGDLKHSVKVSNRSGVGLINISRGISFVGNMTQKEIYNTTKEYEKKIKEAMNQ